MNGRERSTVGEELGLKLLQSVRDMKAGQSARTHRMQPTLLETLQSLEVELHHPGVRCDAGRLDQLLHADFHEVGRSGRPYDRVTVLRFLAEQASPPPVVSSDFAVRELAPGVALLTYRSAHRRPDGTLEHHTFRSSVWLHTEGGWQLYYHQGTPALEIPEA